MNSTRIVVTGDVCISELQSLTSPKNNYKFNYQKHPQVKRITRGGEALLLADLVRKATNAKVISPCLEKEDKLIRSIAEIDLFPKHKSTDQFVYRISNFYGFSPPKDDEIALLPIKDDDENAEIVIMDDENNGFNMSKSYWPKAIFNKDHKPVILYKMNRPAGSSELWHHLEQNYADKTIIIINSEDIRAQGVNISKSLSWEKTAEDFVWQLNNNPNLIFLTKCRHLVVPFGLEGCIYYNNEDKTSFYLHFIPNEIEGSFAKRLKGKMFGLTSCFVAALSRSIVLGLSSGEKKLSLLINEGIKEGISAAQNYFNEGFGNNLDEFNFPLDTIFHEPSKDLIIKEQIQEVVIPSSNRGAWYILKDKSSTSLAEIAYTIVKNGLDKALNTIPMASFRNLKTIDRTEIESYRSIKNLMSEYIANKNSTRPLSIAVFGTPGSGKSFGVTEVANSIAFDLIVKLTCNLSQLSSLEDLIKVFHKARDFSLQGKLPLIIFDEFDTEFKGKLGWLKYFLAPMQDGVFRDGDSEHHIGKSIFVFAGGTSSTFEEFCGENIHDEEERIRFNKQFRQSKGLDFISRLRGYVNILGPNPTHEDDSLFIIRRAMVLRSIIERKTPHLIAANGEAKIDDGVLRAMLKVPKFKHETRSMEAIVEMSRLNYVKKWEQSHLPPKEQLKLHVDEEQFMRHLMHDAFFSENIKTLAEHLFYSYNRLDGKDSKWEDASKEIKSFYMDLARNIPDALLFIKYDIVSVNDPKIIELTEEELEVLAKYEHSRWLLHKKNRGWKYGEREDKTKKTDPDILSFNLLPKNKRDIIIEFVRTWPEVLRKINCELTR